MRIDVRDSAGIAKSPEPAAGALLPFQFASFSSPDVLHGITGRTPGLHRAGDMSFVTGGDAAAVLATRHAWAARIGVEIGRAVAARQVHGARVGRVTAEDAGRGARSIAEALPDTDALVTDAPGLPLLMCFADCTPLLFHDPVRRVVGLAHAGWRGTVADIAGETVRAMVEWYGSRPDEIRAGIGPSIGPCCYVVGRDVVEAWRRLGVEDERIVRPVPGRDEQWHYDLRAANRALLERAGVPAGQVQDAAVCTSCRVADYFSHRAERGQAGRFAAVIALSAAAMARGSVTNR